VLHPRPSAAAYSVAADLGVLSSQSCHVVWSEAVDNGTTLQLSADLNPAAVGGGVQAVGAPALSGRASEP